MQRGSSEERREEKPYKIVQEITTQPHFRGITFNHFNIAFATQDWKTGLEITAGQRTMSGQKRVLSGQMFG